MSKWTSRKWLATVWTEVVGIGTALAGAVYSEREVFYAGLSICVAALVAYLKAEKDVDVARQEVEAARLDVTSATLWNAEVGETEK